ncbi:hypothetical protein LXA43DRAFT_245379 [Ganoderma leucocontextum]|nr:hypothetical protein LXA43DRAFT_245379 [Ganoderma leucocontextum]
MSSSSTSRRSVRWADQAHRSNANAPGAQPPRTTTQFVPPSILTPQIPLVDISGWFPPTPRIPLLELPALLPLPEPLLRLHSALTSVTFQWDVRLHPEPAQLSRVALTFPAFDSANDIKSFTLHFNPLPGTSAMDYTCDITASTSTPITIGRVFRRIYRALHAPLEDTALPQGDPYRSHAERTYHRRTSRPFDGRVDVLRNVDLHPIGGSNGLYFHGITVEEAQGAYGPYPVFWVLLKEYAPFP